MSGCLVSASDVTNEEFSEMLLLDYTPTACDVVMKGNEEYTIHKVLDDGTVVLRCGQTGTMENIDRKGHPLFNVQGGDWIYIPATGDKIQEGKECFEIDEVLQNYTVQCTVAVPGWDHRGSRFCRRDLTEVKRMRFSFRGGLERNEEHCSTPKA